jgi:DNA repair exonuclease SbcCD ATPase subunit
MILLTSDWHVSVQNLSLCERLLEQILELLEKGRVSTVIHLGDFKHVLNPIDIRAANFLVSATQEISRRCSFYVLLGNHDRIGLDDSQSTIQPVLEAAGAIVIAEPIVQSLGKFRAAFVPFIRDETRLQKVFQNLPKANYLFFHSELAKVRWNHYKACDKGLDLKTLGPRRFRYCFGGHIHLPQQFSPNIHFVGSPFCCDWSEVNQSKRLLLVEGNRITSIPLDIETFYDPDAPGYKRPRQWTKHCVVRVRLPETPYKNLTHVIQEERAKAEKAYHPARVQLIVPAHGQTITSDTAFKTEGKSDQQLIEAFLTRQETPASEALVPYLTYHLTGSSTKCPRELQFIGVECQETLSFRQMALDYHLGLNLITGINADWNDRSNSNGSGKSNALALPAIALLGKNIKGQEHDQWRRDSDSPEGPTLVSLHLKVDGREMEVIRGRQPALLQIREGKKIITSGDIRQAQSELEAITGLTADTLLNSLYIDQREVNALLSGTEKERKQLLARFLGLERFDQAAERVRKELLQNQRSLEQLDQQKVDVDQRQAREEQMLREVQVPDQKPFQQSKQKAEKSIRLVTVQLQNCQSLIHRLHREEKVLVDQHEAITPERDRAYGDKRVAEHSLERLNEVKVRCPLCRQKVDPSQLTTHKNEIRRNLEQASAHLTELVKKQQSLWASVKEQQVKIEKLEGEERGFRNQLAQQEKDLQWALVNLEQFKKVEGIAEKHRIEIHRLTNLQKLLAECDQLQTNDDGFLKQALKAVSRDGLPAFLIEAICPRLNTAAAFYSELFAEGEIRVEFAIAEDRSLDVQIANLHGANTIRGQSGGEMRIASLITSFSVREVLARFNLLILDEPGDSLDEVNARTFAVGLNTVADRFGSILVTTHNPHIIANINPDHHYVVTKQNGISTLQEVQ